MVLGDSPKRKYRRDDAQYNISVGDAFMGPPIKLRRWNGSLASQHAKMQRLINNRQCVSRYYQSPSRQDSEHSCCAVLQAYSTYAATSAEEESNGKREQLSLGAPPHRS
jgi:hypothetical protein